MTAALEGVARELGALLRQLKGLHTEVTIVAGVRLELPALAVLVALDADGAQRPSALAETLMLDLSTVSRQLSALERDGRVVRQRDPQDNRAQLVELSAAGQDLLAVVRATRVQRLAARLPHWSEQELSSFGALLSRFTADISAPHPDCRLLTGPDPAGAAPRPAATHAAATPAVVDLSAAPHDHPMAPAATSQEDL